MALNLCIDWGNSDVKAGLFRKGKLEESFRFSANEAHNRLIDILDTHNPDYGIICSVSSASAEVEERLTGSAKRFIKMDNRTPTPVMNAYSSDSVGMDRLAMAVGAHHEHPAKNNLVVCLGTCITYNFVQNTRTFRGGAISPGLKMRLRAMHEFTDKLPQVSLDGETLLLGYDTDTCMRSGAVYGIISEIDGMVNEFAAKYQDFNAVLTGGDMQYFEGKLKCEIFADPDIILKGLNIILKHNAPQSAV